jgi:hypothetical protein
VLLSGEYEQPVACLLLVVAHHLVALKILKHIPDNSQGDYFLINIFIFYVRQNRPLKHVH